MSTNNKLQRKSTKTFKAPPRINQIADVNMVFPSRIDNQTQDSNLNTNNSQMIIKLENLLSTIKQKGQTPNQDIIHEANFILGQQKQKSSNQSPQYFSPNESFVNAKLKKEEQERDKEFDENYADNAEEQQNHDGDTIYDSQSTTMQKSQNDFWDMIGQGIKRVVIMPIKGIEYIMDGGQKSNKMLMKKMMLKNNDHSAQSDKKDQPESKAIIYAKRFLFYIQYVFMPLLIMFSSVLSIFNQIVWNYYTRGYLQEQTSVEYLRLTDYVQFFFNLFKYRCWLSVFQQNLFSIFQFQLIWMKSLILKIFYQLFIITSYFGQYLGKDLTICFSFQMYLFFLKQLKLVIKSFKDYEIKIYFKIVFILYRALYYKFKIR